MTHVILHIWIFGNAIYTCTASLQARRVSWDILRYCISHVRLSPHGARERERCRESCSASHGRHGTRFWLSHREFFFPALPAGYLGTVRVQYQVRMNPCPPNNWRTSIGIWEHYTTSNNWWTNSDFLFPPSNDKQGEQSDNSTRWSLCSLASLARCRCILAHLAFVNKNTSPLITATHSGF
jgi:hypothetical protein